MSGQSTEDLGITEVATLADVTPRTVRYYVAEGLLPPPTGSGQQRVYTREHVARLKAIRFLKDAFLPLSEIRQRLQKMTPDDVERLVQEGPPPTPSSALEYLAAVMPDALPARLRERPEPPPAPSPARPATPRQSPPETTWPGLRVHRMHQSPLDVSKSSHAASTPTETEWRRIVLAPGIELQYQPSDDRAREVLIAQIAQAAIQVLSERPPTANAGGVS